MYEKESYMYIGGSIMNLTLEIPESILNESEKQRLMDTLNMEEELDMKGIIMASFIEYKDMLLGNGLPTRADEIKQHRLFHLIKQHFRGRIPNESEVSRMFQLTETESKSLIKNVRTRFRYQLESEINNTLKEVVENCSLNIDKYETIIQSDNVLEELNRILTQVNPSLEPIKKVRDSSRKYTMSEDTYNALRSYFRLDNDGE